MLPHARNAIAALSLALACATAADWPAHRGNAQRTGNLDGKPGPKAPAVLWTYKAQEHFVASPVPGDGALYIGGLGAFNTGVFHALATQPDAPRQVLWTKAAPFMRRPTVCAPALAEGLLVFGDGMHQTHGAILYCLRADSGRPAWQLPMPGKDIRMECSPTVHQGRVYIGGGGAGVLCVDLKRVTLDGKDTDLAAAQALVEKQWAALLAKYEADRKKDPDFAVPPDDDALPRPVPKALWQKGKGAWYVGAPVCLAGDRLLVGSQYLDDEKIGKRALLCLRASDGGTLWEAPLELNPWTGATQAGGLALVGGSSIRFDMSRIPGARGEVVAVDIASGKVRWRKPVSGGVLSPIAVKGNLALFTATDGKLHAWKVDTGEPLWAYDAGTPFFGGVAIAGDAVYAADLKAVVHAVKLADGARLWAFNVAADRRVLAPGTVYGAPVVHGGRIYLATGNVEGPGAGQPSVVVSIAEKADVAQRAAHKVIAVDRQARRIRIPCRIAPRKLPHLKEIYPIEVVATHPHPRGQKAHETIVTILVEPTDVHKGLEAIGLKPGQPAKGEREATGPEVHVSLELPAAGGEPRAVPIESVLVDRTTGKPMPPVTWHFTGSAQRQPDPNKPETFYGADLSGTLIALFPVTDETVLQSSLTMAEEGLLKLDTNVSLLPAEDTEATVVISVPTAVRAARGSRTHPVFVPPAPFGARPIPCPQSALVPISEGWWLPPTRIEGTPHPLPAELRPLHPGSLPGSPPLPYEAAPLALPRLDTPPPLRAPSPDPAALLDVAAAGHFLGRSDLATDPPGTRQVLLPPIDSLGNAPAPFLGLRIPDPFAGRTAIRLGRPIPDDDLPASVPDLPARPTLAVGK